MPQYNAQQIYAFARQAGFSPDQSATMTAIALAESRGNSNAHNPRGEDSKGLWQINARAHPQFNGMNLYDPLENAKAAFKVSHGGADISPWTTTHGGMSARYLRFRAEAEAAGAAYGDGNNLGMWSGTASYGDHKGAGDPRGSGHNVQQASTSTSGSGSDNVNVGQTAPATAGAPRGGEEFGLALETPPGVQSMSSSRPGHRVGEEFGLPLDGQPAVTASTPAAQATPAGDGTKLQKFLDAAVAQTGDRYVFGAETKMNDPNPSTFDCSELVEWAAHQAGVKVQDGAWNQFRSISHNGGIVVPVDQAVHTPGALLFSFSSDPNGSQPKAAHVAISLGNGKTIEAKGSQYGVGSWEASTKRFQYAVIVPEFAPGPGGTPITPAPSPPPAAHQQDAFAHRVNNDPAKMDHQPDTLAASQQLTAAEPPPPPPPVPEPPVDPHTPPASATDVDNDGQDDALNHAVDWPDPLTEHPGASTVDEHDPGHHDTDPTH